MYIRGLYGIVYNIQNLISNVLKGPCNKNFNPKLKETATITMPTICTVSWALLSGPETCSYHLTYLYYDEPGGGWTRNLLLPPNLLSVPVPGARIWWTRWWLDLKPTPTTKPTICTCSRGPDMMNQVVAGPETYSYHHPLSCPEEGRIELKLRCPSLTSFRWGKFLGMRHRKCRVSEVFRKNKKGVCYHPWW